MVDFNINTSREEHMYRHLAKSAHNAVFKVFKVTMPEP